MLSELEQDYLRYSKQKGNIAAYLRSTISNHGFRAIALYRLGRWLFERKRYRLSRVIENVLYQTCHCDISCAAQIGPGLRMAHPVGIVIGEGTHIGAHCDVLQNSTFGGSFHRQGEDGRTQPRLEDNISVGAGAVIIGPVRIGSNSIIGANSVVTRDVPSNVVVAGSPAKILKERLVGSAE